MTRHVAEVVVTRVFSMMTEIRLSGITPDTVNITSPVVIHAVRVSAINQSQSSKSCTAIATNIACVCFLVGKNNSSSLIIILQLS